MRILMVAPEQIPVPGTGSVEICMLAIARQLAKNHRVTIVSRRKRGMPQISRMGALTIVRVPAGSRSRYVSSVLRYIAKHRFDLIQVDNRPHYMAQIKKRYPHIPVSLFLHSLTFVPKRRSVAASLNKADRIIANSRSLRASLCRRFPGSAPKVRMVHLGVDTNRFKPAKRKPGAFRVLFVGRIIPRKGVPTLIRAMSIVRRKAPEASLTVAGKGSRHYLRKLKGLAGRLGVPVRFPGQIPHEQVHELYRKADCFACPSQRHEAFGLVNVEAMASGLPVVASRNGGIKEIVKHNRNGYLVGRYRSPRAFAGYIGKLAGDRGKAARFGQESRKLVLARFTWHRTAAGLSSLYENL